jgi:hypothetical protein
MKPSPVIIALEDLAASGAENALHAHVVTLGDVQILFSYGNPVAFHVAPTVWRADSGTVKPGYYITAQRFSKTTSNHVHQWAPHDRTELSVDDFAVRLRQAVRHAEV